MGAEVVPRGKGFAYRFGESQLNLHGPEVDGTPVARLPVPQASISGTRTARCSNSFDTIENPLNPMTKLVVLED